MRNHRETCEPHEQDQSPDECIGACFTKHSSTQTHVRHVENYLSQIKCRNHCKALTALRTSAHKLEIETGRYARPFIERDKRYCTLCKKTESLCLGDEHHAIMQCPTFHVQRTKLLSKVCEYCPMFQYLSDYEQFIYLLTCEGNSIRYVSSFVHEVLSASRKPPK